MNEKPSLFDASQAIVKAEAPAASTFMSMIERAVTDPNFDADKLEKLISANERIINRQAQMEYDAAMIRLQKKLSDVKILKNSMIDFSGKGKDGSSYSQKTPYAKLEDIDKVLRPLMQSEGFVVTYPLEGAERVIVKCKISHQGGHSEISSMQLPLDTSGSKNNLQGAGSSISYGKRYLLCAMLNLITLNEDDDGAGGTITDDQAAELKTLLRDSGMDTARFLKVVSAESVDQIKTRDHGRALNSLQAALYRKEKDHKKKEEGNA